MSTAENTLLDGYVQSDYYDEEIYLDLECPDCRKIMPDDDTFLNHICAENTNDY